MRERKALKPTVGAVVGVCYSVGLAGTMAEFSVPPVTSIFQSHMHVTAVSAGFLMSVFAFATLLTALPAGMVVHKFGAKIPAMVGLVLSAAGALLVAGAYFDVNFLYLLGARFLSGMGFGLISVAAPAAISQEVPSNKLSAAMGIWATWVPAGSVVMFVLAPRLISTASVLPLVAVLVAADAAALIALIFLPLHQHHVESDHHPTGGVSGTFWKAMIWTGIGFACFTFDFFAFNTWLTTFLLQQYRVALIAAGLIGAGVSVLNALFNLVSGWQLGRPKVPWGLGFILPAWLLPVVWVLTPQMGFSLMLLMIAFIGILGGVIPTLVFAAPGRVSTHPSHIPRAMSIVIIGENFGIMVGPPAVGALIGPHQFAGGFALMAAVSVVMAFSLMQVIKFLKVPLPAQPLEASADP